MKGSKLLGQAEIRSGRVVVRLSRSADPTRKRIPLDPSVATTLEEGRQIAHEMSLRALEKHLDPLRRPEGTAPEAIEKWLEIWHADRLARKIVNNDRHDRGRLREHILPIIGGRSMAHIPRERIEAIVTSLDAKVARGELGWKTATTTWGIVRTMFRDACRSKNPALRVRNDDPSASVEPPERGDDKTRAFLYPSEFLQLVSSRTLTHGEGLPAHIAANVANASRRWLRAFSLAAYLGLRAGELRALRWDDVDLEHWTIHVHRATKRDTGGKVEAKTKTGVTRRFEIEPAIRPLLEAMHAEAKGDGKAAPTGKVIKLPHEGDLSSRLMAYLKWSGVKRAELYIDDETRCSITFKDLRATYATWRAIRGDEPLKIQRAAGHKSLNTTQIYIRAAEDLGKGAGVPFPRLPAFVIGKPRGLTIPPSKVAKSARPRSGPRLAPKSAKSLKRFEKVASPAGFEPSSVAISSTNLHRLGPNGPKDDDDRAPLPPMLGPKKGALARAIVVALDEAIREGRADEAAELAGELALASARRRA